MEAPSLLVVCCTAFVAVFVLLIVLAILIRLMCAAVPARRGTDDAVYAAAIHAAVATLYPGARVTRIEEQT